MTDRWTEAQLRDEIYWVLSIQWAGGTFYLSTDSLYITDGADTITTMPDLVDYPAVEGGLEVWGVEGVGSVGPGFGDRGEGSWGGLGGRHGMLQGKEHWGLGAGKRDEAGR